MTPMSSPLDGNGVANTDRELWREREGDFYADSLHVTANGGIGINCGGTVIVKPLRDWFALASAAPSQTAVEPVADALRAFRLTGSLELGVAIDNALSTLTAQAATLVAAKERVAALTSQNIALDSDGIAARKAAARNLARAEAAESEVATLKARIAELEAGLEPPYEFDRYVNGVLMAEGVTIEAVTDLAKATLRAGRIASRGPNGEAPVLVLRARRLTHQEKNNG